MDYNRENIHLICWKKTITPEQANWLRHAPKKYQSTAIKNALKRHDDQHKYHFVPQANNIRSRTWTVSLVYDVERVKALVEALIPKYAYIIHDKDEDAGIHTHFYLEFPNAVFLNPTAEKLNIPAHMLEKVDTKVGFLRYLTHENTPGKHHYDISEVVANFDVAAVTLEAEKKLKRSFVYDSIKFQRGELKAKEYLDRHIEKISCSAVSTIYRIAGDIASRSTSRIENPEEITMT